jgi:hypothetical protein
MVVGAARPMNRQMVIELHGAGACFDCLGAMLATDGRILADAAEVRRQAGSLCGEEIGPGVA